MCYQRGCVCYKCYTGHVHGSMHKPVKSVDGTGSHLNIACAVLQIIDSSVLDRTPLVTVGQSSYDAPAVRQKTESATRGGTRRASFAWR